MNRAMTFRCIAVVLLLPMVAMGGKFYEKASVTRMETVRCSNPPSRGFWSSLAGPAATPEGACSEYTIQTEKVEFRLRPRRLVILPVGEQVDLRVTKKQVVIRVEDSPDEIDCDVFSMRMVGDESRTVRQSRNVASREPR